MQLVHSSASNAGNESRTMSSREIAELCGRSHDNVRRDIQNMGRSLSLTFEEKRMASSGGRPSIVYLLDKRETLILVSGYNIQMRARIIDRWQELEAEAANGAQFQIPQSLPEALRLAADLAEQNKALEATVAKQEPTVRAFTRLADATGTLCIRDAAKVLQVRPIELTTYLESHGWIYRHGDEWRAYQTRITAGLLTQKEVHLWRANRVRIQIRISQKGVTKLARAFECPAAA